MDPYLNLAYGFTDSIFRFPKCLSTELLIMSFQPKIYSTLKIAQEWACNSNWLHRTTLKFSVYCAGSSSWTHGDHFTLSCEAGLAYWCLKCPKKHQVWCFWEHNSLVNFKTKDKQHFDVIFGFSCWYLLHFKMHVVFLKFLGSLW